MRNNDEKTWEDYLLAMRGPSFFNMTKGEQALFLRKMFTTFTTFWVIQDYTCGIRTSVKKDGRVPGYPQEGGEIFLPPINGVIWSVKHVPERDQFSIAIGGIDDETGETREVLKMNNEFDPQRFLSGMGANGWRCVEVSHENFHEAQEVAELIPGSRAVRWEDRRGE